MKILHVVPGLNEVGNGMAVVARLLAEEQRQAGHEVELIETRQFLDAPSSHISVCGEIWVHSMWLPMTMKACWKVIRSQGLGVRLVRMTHGCLSPIYLERQGKWKKRLAACFERRLLSKTNRVVVTCEAERKWCEQWGVKGPFEITDLKRFFKLGVRGQEIGVGDKRALHVLYLGRRHPLKGVHYLEQAVAELAPTIDLRIVSDHLGEELEKDWEWCDVLCLPTLSDNFGLVVAEALEHGKQVITTDGAPAWADEPRVVYLRGFREGPDEKRVGLLVEALKNLARRML